MPSQPPPPASHRATAPKTAFITGASSGIFSPFSPSHFLNHLFAKFFITLGLAFGDFPGFLMRNKPSTPLNDAQLGGYFFISFFVSRSLDASIAT